MTPNQMVGEFHAAFGVQEANAPTLPVMGTRDLRLSLIMEEVDEFEVAYNEDDLVAVADALADLLYVTYGAARVFGIDLDAVVAEVHRANMSKLGADWKPVLRADGKILKGPNYSPPNIAAVLGVTA